MKLTDGQLERLLTLANQAERLARPEVGVLVKRRGWKLVSGGLAAAAALALVAGAWWLAARGGVDPRAATTRPAMRTAHAPAATPTERESVSSMLLAIAENAAGEMSCVGVRRDALAHGRTWSEMETGELERLGREAACDAQAPRLLVVGLQGPAQRLPSTDDEAVRLAGCLRAASGCGTESFNAGTCAASGCALPGVNVRVASITR